MAQDLFRHTLATLAYRAGKALRGAPPEFSNYMAGKNGRTPAQILAHMGDLLDWARSILGGAQRWHASDPLPWDKEVERFFAALQALDAALSKGEPLAVSAERLFQGPVADALTHVGQLAMLRRMAGYPVSGENYFVADIEVGRVGLEQSAARREF